MIKKHWRTILSLLPLFAFTAALFGYLVIRPNSWNIVYFEMGPKKYYKPKSDSIPPGKNYTISMIPHTFFELGSSAYKKCKHGDTIPVFQNGKIVGELKLTGNILDIWSSTTVWMKPE